MRFFRVGDKVISRERLFEMVSEILTDRERGATQEEAAASHGVQRSFVSFLESLGEVRRGPRVALVAFPISNVDAVNELAERHAVEHVLLMDQAERTKYEGGSGAEVFNRVLDTLAELAAFDVVILAASDMRIRTIERILGGTVVPIVLGESPMSEAVELDVEELSGALESITTQSRRTRRAQRRTRKAAKRQTGPEAGGRWASSKR